MSIEIENEKYDKENEIKIKESPSFIIKKTLERSFSDSSIQSYKKYADLLSKKEIEEINFSNKKSIINNFNYNKINNNIKNIYNPIFDFKNIIQSTNKEINNNNNIIQKIQELKELNNNYTSRNQYHYLKNNKIIIKSPMKSPNQLISKIEYIKNKNGTLKFFLDNSNALQKKEKKLLTGLISSKFKEQDDIEEFKNQFELSNKSPFGCLDFKRKFKISFNVNNPYKFTKIKE